MPRRLVEPSAPWSFSFFNGIIFNRAFHAPTSASTRLLAATTLRNVLGMRNLSEILSDRENISHSMQSSLDEATDPWGVKVERVEM